MKADNYRARLHFFFFGGRKMFNVELSPLLDEVKLLNGCGKKLFTELERTNRLLKYGKVEAKKVSDIVDEIRKIHFEIEDVIETYVASKRKEGLLKRVFGGLFSRQKLEPELSTFEDQILDMNERLQLCYDDKTLYEDPDIRDNSDLQTSFVDFEEAGLVGIEEKVKIVEAHFQSKESPIIGIWGMGGIGKTTLAREIYQDKSIRGQFDAFAWVTVGQELHMKSLLVDVLVQLNPSSREEVLQSMDLELAQKLYGSLQSRKCLIVLDDIWSISSWDNLKICLPTGKSTSRIVITTRTEHLARKIADVGESIEMKTLSVDDSWQLFLKKQSSDFKANHALEEMGKNVIKKCGGLPLAIVLLGSILKIKQTSGCWTSVLKAFESALYREQNSSEFYSIPKVLRLSYEYLPFHLRNCFLYMGMFPKDSKIEVKKLINLWVAEGFVSSDNGENETNLGDIAEHYLYELVTRNLILVQKEHITRVRRFKSCQIHDVLREMCLLKAKEENMLKVLDSKSGKLNQMDSYPSMAMPRRLSVYLNMPVAGYDMFFRRKASNKVRSLLFLNCRRQGLGLRWPRSISLRNFRLLRVLGFSSINFQETKLPEGLEYLSNLRYLSLENCYLKELPSSIGNLSSLETLDLRVCGGFQITLPNVLWKLECLRNLYLPFSYKVHKGDKLRLNSHRSLETLENFDSSYCDSKDLLKMYNLRYLVVATEGSFEDVEVIIKSMTVALGNLRESSLDLRNFDCYSRKRKSAVEKVLAIRTLHTLHMEGHLGRLPELITPSLTKISFSACEFTEDPMATLEKLPNLYKLVLHNGAFIGKQMTCSASGFPCLRRLKLSYLQKLEKWTIEEGALSKLSTLTIESCKNLAALPHELIHLSNLQTLSIFMMPETFTCRHQKEGKDFYKIQHIPEINFGSRIWKN